MQTRIILPAILIIASSIAARAQLIDLNVFDGGQNGAALLGAAGDQWNHVVFNNATYSTVIDSTGSTVPSGTFSTSNWFIAADGSLTDGPIDSHPNLFGTYALGVPFINPDKGTGPDYNPSTIDLTGLDKNAVYTLVLYSRNQSGANGRNFTVTTTGMSGSSVSATLVNADNLAFTSDLNSGQTATWGNPTYDGNYLLLYVKTDALGDLNLSLNSRGGDPLGGLGTGGEFDVSGLQLERGEVPEPSVATLMVAGLGMLCLMIARKRRHDLIS